MFTDEVGDNLVEVKKYDEAEPIRTPEPELAEVETEDTDVVFDDIKIDEIEESFNNVENVRYMDSVTDRRRENVNLKIFGNPNIRKSQVKCQSILCYSNKPLQGIAPTECTLSAYLHACLFA